MLKGENLKAAISDDDEGSSSDSDATTKVVLDVDNSSINSASLSPLMATGHAILASQD